jgi:hypothetical protein
MKMILYKCDFVAEKGKRHIVVVEKESGCLPATAEGIWWHHRDEI